jgi:hypothetical protein
MKDREKEIKHLMYLKSQLIKETKKEVKELQQQLRQVQGEKNLTKRKGK